MAGSARAADVVEGSAEPPAPGVSSGRLRIVSREVAHPRGTPPAEPGSPADPHLLAARLAQVIAEVVTGARSPGQLSGVATLAVLRQLERGVGRFGATAGGHQTRPIVRSVHVSRIDLAAAEVCAVIITGHRVRALALRLEAVDTRWRCTALQLG